MSSTPVLCLVLVVIETQDVLLGNINPVGALCQSSVEQEPLFRVIHRVCLDLNVKTARQFEDSHRMGRC